MTCEMEINTTGSSVFQHRFQFPKQFQVKQVFLSREDQRLPIRIAVSSDQKLTVFLTEGVIGKQHLRVEGEWPHNGKTATIPRLEMETGKILTRRVRGFRKPEILVQFDGNPEDVQLSNGESGRFQAALGRLVVDWEESLDGAKPKQGQLMLKLRPNQRRLRCSSVTQVFRKEAAWWAAIDCHVNVLNGVCDELQLDIPESWTGVFQLTPAMPFEVKRLPGIPQRRMIIRPETAMTGDFRVRIESPLLLPAGGIRVPEILPLGMQRTASYVVMPNHLDQQKLAWETSGLQRIASLPETMATGVITSDSTVARVVSTHFRAHIKEVQQIKTDPFIHLVDVRLGWTAEGECSGVTTFDLEPAGRTECVLRVPPQYQLIAVRVAGLPGALTELEAGRFSLQLGPSQLAQRIEVVFRGQIVIRTAVVKRVKTATPTIEDFPVGRTLWTVRALNSIGSGRYQNDEGAATSEQQAALQRLNTIAAMVETATENRSELTGQRINDWFLHWERRFTSVESSWNRWRAATAGTEQESSLLETVDRYHQLKRRLGVDGAGRRDDQQLPQAAGAEEVWETVVTGTDILSDFEGQQTDLDLVYPGIPRSSDFGLRLLVALGIFFIAGVGWKLKRMGSLGEWWARWPYVTGVCVGLGWWLWLSPSLLGLVIMAVSSIAALVPSWAPLPLPQANSEAKTITDFPRLR